MNQLMLLKSLIETKVANEVLIPPDTVPAPPPPPLKDPPSIMRVSPRRSPPERPSRAATLNPRALISPNPIDTLAGGSGRLGGRSSGSGAGVSAFGPADGRSSLPWRRMPQPRPQALPSSTRRLSIDESSKSYYNSASGSGGGSGGGSGRSLLSLPKTMPLLAAAASEDDPEALRGESYCRPSRQLAVTSGHGDGLQDQRVVGVVAAAAAAAAADVVVAGGAAGGCAREAERLDRSRAIGERFKVGELSCECKYTRRFGLNHRLRGDKVQAVLKNLDSKTLAHAKVPSIGQLYVYPDMQRNIFYMTLSGVCKDRAGGEVR